MKWTFRTKAKSEYSPPDLCDAVFQSIQSLPPPTDLNTDEMPSNIQDPLELGIYFHEINKLQIATYYFSIAASHNSAIGILLYAISLRHGWGIDKNECMALKLLQQCSETILDQTTRETSGTLKRFTAKSELGLVFFELYQSFSQGWYFEELINAGVFQRTRLMPYTI